MKFTYSSYESMIDLLRKNDYKICNYQNYKKHSKCVILRHDVDESLTYAHKLARLEYENNIKSTYFILLSSDFYNIFSKKSHHIIKDIKAMEHDIGLHFDEAKYDIKDEKSLKEYIQKEVDVMSLELGFKIKAVSMHRPSKWILHNDVKLDGLINSYSRKFFDEFKYVSDSRLNWRENIEEIITSNKYNRLHILTHAFGYKEKELTPKEIYIEFMRDVKEQVYNSLDENTKNISEFLKRSEI